MQRSLIKEIVAWAIAEDLGWRDITTDSIFSTEEGKAALVAREDGIIAGLEVAREVFRQVDPHLSYTTDLQDGNVISAGAELVKLEGPVAGILKGERVALNFLQRMSGTATATGEAVEAVRGTGARITDTRKTTPGLRILEKHAVRMGGGENHRFNLSDMALIKDNHIRRAGSIRKAVEKVKERAGFTVKIEVEVENLEELQEALASGVDIIMLDNMPVPQMAEAVRLINRRALCEASGGITRDKLLEVAQTGVDLISLGYLTGGSQRLDLALEVTP